MKSSKIVLFGCAFALACMFGARAPEAKGMKGFKGSGVNCQPELCSRKGYRAKKPYCCPKSDK